MVLEGDKRGFWKITTSNVFGEGGTRVPLPNLVFSLLVSGQGLVAVK